MSNRINKFESLVWHNRRIDSERFFEAPGMTPRR
jgi:hypothetical protein